MSTKGLLFERAYLFKVEMEVNFEDCLNEIKKDIRLNVEEKCGTCTGTGVRPGTSPKKCTQCGGTGMVSLPIGYHLSA